MDELLVEGQANPIGWIDGDGTFIHVVEGYLGTDGHLATECWCPHSRVSLPHPWHHSPVADPFSCPLTPTPRTP